MLFPYVQTSLLLMKSLNVTETPFSILMSFLFLKTTFYSFIPVYIFARQTLSERGLHFLKKILYLLYREDPFKQFYSFLL